MRVQLVLRELQALLDLGPQRRHARLEVLLEGHGILRHVVDGEGRDVEGRQRQLRLHVAHQCGQLRVGRLQDLLQVRQLAREPPSP